ncbi:LysE family translocator [Bordetella hinzii]|uniref:LysE family translocator n=1 Tax=Bordetella hinzii TaxID=103855 RepID=A0AAN1RZ97_9BORD|nr:LysE family translocator [Bordetella hinzii]AKQ60986.1 Threonine efflux protein [Bordetella hinzii]AZW18007.1 LysE family translocator [Bordetella hinzii]KCB48697.1 translocator protein, LysE family [Bordetella hinzii 4161]KXA73176.1 lysine transporter LysE [Bordetella hinzii LMG 13501]MBZ0075993.1 LysE family translocator [Bordetella hinzii]
MPSFLLIASAHFLALLSPGPDFFLVARSALAAGWRTASGACLGIALANGLFIVLAFGGVSSLRDGGLLFRGLQAAGGAYLVYLGLLFLRHAGRTPLDGQGKAAGSWWRALGMGLFSGVLNPKNALFYASLATLLAPGLSPGRQAAYGLWMFGVVLGWDLLVAVLISRPRVLRRFGRMLPWLERGCGLILGAMGAGLLASLALAF